MTLPFWDDSPETWHTVAIDGAVLPGVARIDSVRRPRKTHHTQPSGVRGGRTRDRGAKLVKFKVVVRVWTAEQLEHMRFLLPSLDYRTEPAPTARTSSTAVATIATPITDEQRILMAEDDFIARDERNVRFADDELVRDGLRPTAQVRRGRVLPATTAADRAATAREQQAEARQARADASRLRAPVRRVRRAVSIAHPALDLMGVNRVFVEGVEFQPPKDAKDVGEFTIECVEYTPQPVSGGNGRSVTRTPATLADEQIAPALRPSTAGAGAP